MKMYTQEGTEVELVKKIEEGYLAKLIYYGYGDDEYDGELESICNEITFYEKLFDSPPVEKYSKEIKALKDEAEELSNEISRLHELKSKEESLISKVSRYPIIQQLADYLTGDFSFILFLRNLEIRKRESVYVSKYIRTSNTITEPFALYELRSEYYISDSDDKAFLIFKTVEECQAEAKKRLIDRITKSPSQYNKSGNLKDILNNISDSPAKKDPEVLALYESKLKVYQAEEKKEKEEKLKQDVEQLLKKQRELDNLLNQG